MAANPGRVKKEFKIQLGRPREEGNLDVAAVTAEIMKELKEEVEKVAKAEYDSDWSIKESSILYDSTNDLGAGL
jgi:NitT/TauT family transport system ATP-binding protein